MLSQWVDCAGNDIPNIDYVDNNQMSCMCKHVVRAYWGLVLILGSVSPVYNVSGMFRMILEPFLVAPTNTTQFEIAHSGLFE